MRQPRHRAEHVPRPGEALAGIVLDESTMEQQAAETLAGLSVRTVRSVRQQVSSLSGGQRQTVAIAKAVLWNSKLVILDEPTAALGVAQTAQVLELVRRLADNGLAVVLISHNMNDVFAVADRIAALYLGRMVAAGEGDGRHALPGRRADHRRPQRRPRPAARQRRHHMSDTITSAARSRRPTPTSSRARASAPTPGATGPGVRGGEHGRAARRPRPGRAGDLLLHRASPVPDRAQLRQPASPRAPRSS